MISQTILFDLLANQVFMRPCVVNPGNMEMTSDLDSGEMDIERDWTIFNGAELLVLLFNHIMICCFTLTFIGILL